MTGKPRVWQMSRHRALPLDRPRVLAILNMTPDSFYAGSRADSAKGAMEIARAAVEAGADGIDIGGESTRPGAVRVEEAQQIERIVPVIRMIRAEGGRLGEIPLSVDTTLPAVAELALESGADAINDVSGATEQPEAMLALAARTGAGLILMHRFRTPELDKYSDHYSRDLAERDACPPVFGDVAVDVREVLVDRAMAAEAAGVARGAIMLDPGLGFGKTVEQNLGLIRETGDLVAAGYPVLSAASRKSFVGRVSLPEARQSDPADRLAGSLAFSVMHLLAGARVFRVHDVSAQRQALLAAWAIRGQAD
jgi:dihydropteroate synthase